MSKGSDSADKEGRQRMRACLDKEVTHLRLGTWSRLPDSTLQVTPLGTIGELHGTVCTCCPKRGAADA